MINIIVFAIILLPLLITGKQRKVAIWISFGLLFILFGCQYEMTRDWPVYVNRWLYATKDLQTQANDLEPFYKLIMRLCMPFSYFGYLMLCAIFNLWVFKKYLDKYVPIYFVWFALAIFLLRVNFAFTYINTNRQTLAITCSMLGLYVLLFPPAWIRRNGLQYIVCALFAVAAINIHVSAIIALPIFFFPMICKRLKNTNYLWIFMGVYILSFFVDFNSITNTVKSYMVGSDSLSGFSHYANEIAERAKSIVEQGIYAILLFFLIYEFDKFNVNQRPIALAVIVFISLQGYVMYTMARALLYYQVYSIYVIPLLARRMFIDAGNRKIFVLCFYAIFLAYCVFSFYRNMFHGNYENWANFKTIFSAPVWM